MNYDNTYRGANEGATSAILMFSAGALVGAAAALIFAPTSGREAREFLGKRGKEMADNVAEQGKKMAENMAEQGKKVADNVAEQGRRVWNEHGERVTQAVREGYSNVAETTERAARATESSNPM
jgi:gas vesicle protein